MFYGHYAAGALMLFVVVPAIVMSGSCVANEVAPQCIDGIKSGDETDVDCGGPRCDPCKDDQSCMLSSDCLSKVCRPCTKDGCTGNVCSLPSCDDNVVNGDETDADCGGSCASRCAEDKRCGAGSDCASGFCIHGACVSRCNNMAKDGDESDVDCGGTCAVACTDGKICDDPTVCASGFCVQGMCVSRCNNMAKDDGEADTDCGGSCIESCQDGSSCMGASDCSSQLCINSKCASCSNTVKDGDETDADCGGSCARKCSVGRNCNGNEDCISEACDGSLHLCVPKVDDVDCYNSIQDGDETDVNCGGGACPACTSDQKCLHDSDCLTILKCTDVSGMKTCQKVP